MARLLLFALALLAVTALPARAAVVCTLLADAATGAVLLEEGDCDRPVTPASTFKVPLAVIGFETGLLEGPHAPVHPYRPGDPDWGGEAWTQDTDPARWMRHSVLWYSWHITAPLGAEALSRHAAALGFGNADFTGDPGFGNGLERAWISSSLLITPREQAAFLRGLANGTLPVSARSMDLTRALLPVFEAGGWQVAGKTGGAYPRRADRSFDRSRGIGWFVGWAERDGRRVIIVRLTQDEARTQGSPGIRARDALLAEWPALVGRIGMAD